MKRLTSIGQSQVAALWLSFAICLTLTGEALSASGIHGWLGMAIKVQVDGKTVLGRPVEYNDHYLIMLRRDGRMLEYRRDEIESLKNVGSQFQPYSALKLQQHFRRLFGDQYEVSRTRHYVVVHPPGMRQSWADPFDELHNRFTYYFNVRGFSMKPAEFPMVVIVFNSQGEFNQVAAKDGLRIPSAYAGYYSPVSNWIVTYRGVAPGGDWEKNETLIHEALHQYAFNHGIHRRWAPTPKWCAEGLATMFESRGVNDGRRYRRLNDRVNEECANRLKNLVRQERFRGQLKQLVQSDGFFEEKIADAYALSWGLAFYLSETRPTEFNGYLQRIAGRERYAPYSASDRLADFARHFGGDFAMLESHFANFVGELD